MKELLLVEVLLIIPPDIPGGVVRAYNIRTGDLEWYWDPVPPGMKQL